MEKYARGKAYEHIQPWKVLQESTFVRITSVQTQIEIQPLHLILRQIDLPEEDTEELCTCLAEVYKSASYFIPSEDPWRLNFTNSCSRLWKNDCNYSVG